MIEKLNFEKERQLNDATIADARKKIESNKEEMRKTSMELTERYIKRIAQGHEEAIEFFLSKSEVLQENNVAFYDQEKPFDKLDEIIEKFPEGCFVVLPNEQKAKEFYSANELKEAIGELKDVPLIFFGKTEKLLEESIDIPAKVVNHLEMDEEHGVKKWVPEVEREAKTEQIEIKYRPGFLYVPQSM